MAGGVGRTGSPRPLLLSAGRPGASHSANFSTPAGGERRGWARPEEGGWVGQRQGTSPARKTRGARARRAKRPRLFSRRSLSSLYYSISPALSSVWVGCGWACTHPSRAQGPFHRHGRAEWLWRTGENSGWAGGVAGVCLAAPPLFRRDIPEHRPYRPTLKTSGRPRRCGRGRATRPRPVNWEAIPPFRACR